MKHIVCYSGGHSSALVAIAVADKFGTSDVVLVNHDMHPSVEHEDIKRFKTEVADHLGVPITYVNYRNASMDQFDVTIAAKAFKVGSGSELCTSRLKTEPFMAWLKTIKDEVCCYYGFDRNEMHRVQRRSSIMAAQGYRTDYPLALWPDIKIQDVRQIGIQPPMTYSQFKHANCVGCLKAGWQHWYVVFCTRPDIWAKAKAAEDAIGYSIHSDAYLEDMEEKFYAMRQERIPATEHIGHQVFWAQASRIVGSALSGQESLFPCECVT